jgi:hypothetical protein
MNDKNVIPPHDFAELFPLHDGKPLWELRDDITAHGLLEDIVLYQGKVLDGRRRQAACLAKDVPPRYAEFQGTDNEALDFIFTKQLTRRKLTDAERVMMAAKIAKLSAGRPPQKDSNGSEIMTSPDAFSPTGDEAAERFKASERAVEHIYFVQDTGSWEIKIGRAIDIRRRLASLQCGNPRWLAPLGTLVGDRVKEAELHLRFRHLRVIGEWHIPGADLLDFIRIHCETWNRIKASGEAL